MHTAIIEIPQDVLDSTHLTPLELQRELAISLYAGGRLSIGKARELADLSLWEFRQLIGTRKIAPHFDRQDLQEEIAVVTDWDTANS